MSIPHFFIRYFSGCFLLISVSAIYASTNSLGQVPVIPKSTITYADVKAMEKLSTLSGRIDIQSFAKSFPGISPSGNLTLLQERFRMATKIDPRIVGGWPVRIQDHPWQVALIRASFNDPRREQFCGGTIVGNGRWVATAAHCVDAWFIGRDRKNINIIAGATKYRIGGERIKVANIYVPELWDSDKKKHPMDYDFALLELEKVPSLGKSIEIVKRGAVPKVQEEAFVTGWGARREGGPSSDELLGVSVPVVDRNICNQKESYDGTITEAMFCAGQREGGLDACQGDSGGTIFAARNGKPVLIGVVSFGEGCGRRLKYGVYTNIAIFSLADWIRKIVE